MRAIYIVGLATLAACSKSGPTGPPGPAATPGALVIKILAAPDSAPGCYAFSPDSTSAPYTQQVQWLNTTADTVSIEQDESVFTSAPPGQYTVAAVEFSAPGVLQYGAASCPQNSASNIAYAEIVFTNPGGT